MKNEKATDSRNAESKRKFLVFVINSVLRKNAENANAKMRKSRRVRQFPRVVREYKSDRARYIPPHLAPRFR